jgi:hypothetical protein
MIAASADAFFGHFLDASPGPGSAGETASPPAVPRPPTGNALGFSDCVSLSPAVSAGDRLGRFKTARTPWSRLLRLLDVGCPADLQPVTPLVFLPVALVGPEDQPPMTPSA